MENINLSILPKDGARMLKELAAGNMVAARSKNDFLYIFDFDGQFHLFTHTPGSPDAGRKQFPKNKENKKTIRKLAAVSDAVYMAEFEKGLDIYGVMYTAEEGILSMFPGDDRDSDEKIEFKIPERDKEDH